MSVAVALVALLFDFFVPYPRFLQKALGHPVQWVGKMIEKLEALLLNPAAPPAAQKRAGLFMLALILLATLVPALFIHALLASWPLGWLIEALLAFVLLAWRQLGASVEAVARALTHSSLKEARKSVSHIVGRDSADLDAAEISRAAIESLAENASDGAVAPLFWLALFGLPGIVFYKSVNTADSMVGHLSDKYRFFGWASARLDDWINFVPARLTALLFVGAAAIMQGADAPNSWASARRDAKNHASPNAGWPEAAMAGALHFGLGGPRRYDGQIVALAPMGDGRRDLEATDIDRALRLYHIAGRLVLGCFAALFAAAFLIFG